MVKDSNEQHSPSQMTYPCDQMQGVSHLLVGRSFFSRTLNNVLSLIYFVPCILAALLAAHFKSLFL